MPYQLKRRGGEILVNSETAADQSSPHITSLQGGGFVVAWTDTSGIGGDSSGQAVKAQRFDADGNKVGPEILVNTTVTSSQVVPVVITLASGRFVVTWSDLSAQGLDTSGSSVRAQVFEGDGTRVGGEFLVNTATLNGQSLPDIKELAGGGFVATWSDASGIGGDASGTGIKAQIFNSSSVKVGGEILVNTVVTGSQTQSNVIALATGGFAIAWGGASSSTFNSSTGTTTTGSINLQLFDAAGTPVGIEQSVSSLTTGTFENPTMAALGTGFVLIWARAPSPSEFSTDGYQVKGQLFNASGAKIGGEFTVNATTAGDQRLADVDALPGGGFLVTWQGPGNAVSGTNIYGQVFDDGGLKLGTEFIVTSVTEGNQNSPADRRSGFGRDSYHLGRQ